MASASGNAGGRITAGAGLNLLGQHGADRNAEATVYVGNLDTQVTEELLWELFLQAGPVTNVYVPKDRVTSTHQGFGFVEFRSEEDAEYAIKILNMVKMFGKPIKVNKSAGDRRDEVGANLFIGNLDPDIDEKLLYDTFSAFGVVINTPKIMRDPDTGVSKGFGFVAFDAFEASDAAIEAMNGQFLCNKEINVQYAYKKDSKGERHGSQAERLLAQSIERPKAVRPHTLFSAGPASTPAAMGGLVPPPPPGMGGMAIPPPPPGMMGGLPPPPGLAPPSGFTHPPIGGFAMPPGMGMPPPPGATNVPPPPGVTNVPPPPGMTNVPPPPPQ